MPSITALALDNESPLRSKRQLFSASTAWRARSAPEADANPKRALPPCNTILCSRSGSSWMNPGLVTSRHSSVTPAEIKLSET